MLSAIYWCHITIICFFQNMFSRLSFISHISPARRVGLLESYREKNILCVYVGTKYPNIFSFRKNTFDNLFCSGRRQSNVSSGPQHFFNYMKPHMTSLTWFMVSIRTTSWVFGCQNPKKRLSKTVMDAVSVGGIYMFLLFLCLQQCRWWRCGWKQTILNDWTQFQAAAAPQRVCAR